MQVIWLLDQKTKMGYLFKVLWWWLLSIVKFLFVPFVMMSNPGSEYWTFVEIVLITSSGAALGAFVFFHFGEFIMQKRQGIQKEKKKNKRVFTPMRRTIIRLKTRLGIKGLMLISGLISVPLASLLCARYFKHDKSALAKLILGFFLWSIFLTSLAYIFRIIKL